MRHHFINRLALAASLAALSVGANASAALASVTLGQLPPPGFSTFACAMFDRVQPTVTSGNPYVVPAPGGVTSWTLTSWSTEAVPGDGRLLTMKVYRRVSGNSFMIIGRDGPRTLSGGALNTFSGLSIPLQAGDYVGNSTPAAAGGPACAFQVPVDPVFGRVGDLPVGASGDFGISDLPYHLNTSAVVEPSNTFTLGQITRNKRKGTATLNLTLPNPGDLTGSGSGANVASTSPAGISKSVGTGPAQLLIKAKGKKKRKLNQKGKVKLNVAITYTPTGGDPSSQSVKVKLKKKL
jgi:hypothetical protein